MSFHLTTRQVRERSKTVTRRNGWRRARVGQVVQPIVKGQGLKKGEHVERIGGPIRFVDVRREPLNAITPEDVALEGFPGMTPAAFVELYRRANGGAADQIVTRIEFEYVAVVDLMDALRRALPAAQ
jgi:hypothetical protein